MSEDNAETVQSMANLVDDLKSFRESMVNQDRERDNREKREIMAFEFAKQFAQYSEDEAGDVEVANRAVALADLVLGKLEGKPSKYLETGKVNMDELVAMAKTPEIVNQLRSRIKSDPEMWNSYRANIAEAFVDSFDPNSLRESANKAAETFLNRLCG